MALLSWNLYYFKFVLRIKINYPFFLSTIELKISVLVGFISIDCKDNDFRQFKIIDEHK